MNLSEILFWLISGLLALFYLTYYGLMIHAAKKSNNVLKRTIFPKISLVIPTYNEEKVIQRKLSDILELEYPKDALEVLVVDSGSIDNTLELVEQFSKNHECTSLRLLVQPKREGKASALNYCRPYSTGEIIVLTDADTLFKKDALNKLVASYADQSVGAVSGRLIILNADQSTSTRFEKSYRDIFDILRTGESNLDSTPIFNGPISSFRRELMSDLKLCTVADDTELSMKVREKGWKAIYEPQAIAYEYTPSSFKSKIKQKMRRGQGVIQSFFWHKKMIFNLKYGKYGLFILPSELFMHVISPLLVLTIMTLATLNFILISGFRLSFGVLMLPVLALFGLTKVFLKFSRGKNHLDPFETFATFFSNQISLTLSMLLLIVGRDNFAWEKIGEVRTNR